MEKNNFIMIGLHVCLGELVQNRIVVDDAARSAHLIQCNYHYKFRKANSIIVEHV
jgi:hypothetical protein